MTTHRQNQKAIKEGQQGGPAQKNQATQGGMGAERDRNAPSGVQQEIQAFRRRSSGRSSIPVSYPRSCRNQKTSNTSRAKKAKRGDPVSETP